MTPRRRLVVACWNVHLQYSNRKQMFHRQAISFADDLFTTFHRHRFFAGDQRVRILIVCRQRLVRSEMRKPSATSCLGNVTKTYIKLQASYAILCETHGIYQAAPYMGLFVCFEHPNKGPLHDPNVGAPPI